LQIVDFDVVARNATPIGHPVSFESTLNANPALVHPGQAMASLQSTMQFTPVPLSGPSHAVNPPQPTSYPPTGNAIANQNANPNPNAPLPNNANHTTPTKTSTPSSFPHLKSKEHASAVNQGFSPSHKQAGGAGFTVGPVTGGVQLTALPPQRLAPDGSLGTLAIHLV
jgi:hypothetical protein